MDAKLTPTLVESLGGEEGIRERLLPKPGDRLYFPLADLLLTLQKIATSDSLTILDYGAGLAPYCSLFPNSHYRRADIEAFADPDYIIAPDGRVPETSQTFDVVLSSQVLEHVIEPEIYLSESFRLLKPGGRLFLTTHGSYEDHGCPYDFRRWTADGLTYDLKKAGFAILSMEKYASGPRALLWFLQMYLSDPKSCPSRKTLLGVCHWLCRFVPLRWIHRQADRLYPDCRVVSADLPGYNIYLGLSACAQRPL
jgi:SAM-dependent methyltransferase